MPRNGEKTNLKIREAAIGLFVEKGVDATRTKEIAQAAGISEGNIYRHYESKEALARDLFIEEYQRYGEAVEAIIAKAKSFEDAWPAFVDFLCDEFDSGPNAFRYLLMTQHDFLHDIKKDMPSPVEQLRGYIEKQMKGGRIPKIDPDLAVAIAIGPILQAATFIIYGQLKGPLSKWRDTLVATGWRLVQPA